MENMDSHSLAVVSHRPGVAAKGADCESVGGKHWWYRRDDVSSACYHCEVVRPGQLWKQPVTNDKRGTDLVVEFGPCCFCASAIAATEVDPCSVTVETKGGKWQVWHCHASCFKERLRNPPEAPDLFEPAYF